MAFNPPRANRLPTISPFSPLDLSKIAHQMNSALSMVTMALELVSHSPRRREEQEYFNILIAGVERAMEDSRRLTELARAQPVGRKM